LKHLVSTASGSDRVQLAAYSKRRLANRQSPIAGLRMLGVCLGLSPIANLPIAMLRVFLGLSPIADCRLCPYAMLRAALVESRGRYVCLSPAFVATLGFSSSST
jgi:hypothetical protein